MLCNGTKTHFQSRDSYFRNFTSTEFEVGDVFLIAAPDLIHSAVVAPYVNSVGLPLPLYLSVGLLASGSVTLLYGRVPPDRLPPAHPSLQHHAAESSPPRLTACPAGGGGERHGPLPALESRRA